jgi:hypothetical protein
MICGEADARLAFRPERAEDGAHFPPVRLMSCRLGRNVERDLVVGSQQCSLGGRLPKLRKPLVLLRVRMNQSIEAQLVGGHFGGSTSTKIACATSSCRGAFVMTS